MLIEESPSRWPAFQCGKISLLSGRKERALDAKTQVEIIKNGFEIAAYLAALAFFLYKAFSGYFIVDMSVKLSCERKRKPGSDDRDYLAVAAVVKKGERGGVRLHDAQVRLRSTLQQAITLGPIPLATIERVDRTDLEADPPNIPLRARINWAQIPADAPRLNLPPGDETQLSAFFEIDADEPYLVEAVILARRIFLGVFNGRLGQWRANCISLPIESKTAPPEPNTRETNALVFLF